jgi:hemolysin activation/secretion protein
VRVFEGRITDIIVSGNQHFSSNNIMRALPGLHTNMLLVSQVFQAELDRANANQDRQIYPELQPGPEENTTVLRLKVKDRLPLHAKVEFNNQSSPGTPELRLNSSAVFNNLWQLEQSLGVQYSFSPEAFKLDTPQTKWDFYDRPLVATYSGFYRMPLGNLNAIGDEIAARPGTFGYDEATRKFHLPPPSARPELNFFASRATIDTGLMTTFSGNIYNTNGNSLDRTDVQQDFTVNNSFGSRLNMPLPPTENLLSGLSGGFDYKTYDLASRKTNVFSITSVVIDPGPPSETNINHSVFTTPVGPNGLTATHLEYLPLSVRYDASLPTPGGITAFGLGLSANAWYSGSASNLHQATGSAKSSGYWVILNPTISRDISLYKAWLLSIHAEGQWASEPLVSNEQFGLGGVANVRGYREGEVFGDAGWRVNLELKLPPHVVGVVYGKEGLTVRPSIYMDYGRAYLLDPQGRDSHTSLWGAGFGAVATIGPHWEGRVLFSWPLIATLQELVGQPRFNFALTAQF